MAYAKPAPLARPPVNQGLTIGDERPVRTEWTAFFDALVTRIGATGFRKLTTSTFSTATAGVVFTLPPGLRRFRIDYIIETAVAQAAYMQLSTDGGATWKTGAADYNVNPRRGRGQRGRGRGLGSAERCGLCRRRADRGLG
jgi:hypothetical protein